MDGITQAISDIWQRLLHDPTTQVQSLLVGILFATSTIAFRRRRSERVRIDAPSDVEIIVKPKGEAKVTVVNLKHEGKPDPATGKAPQLPGHLALTDEQLEAQEKLIAEMRRAKTNGQPGHA